MTAGASVHTVFTHEWTEAAILVQGKDIPCTQIDVQSQQIHCKTN